MPDLPDEEPPKYTRYRARPALLRRGSGGSPKRPTPPKVSGPARPTPPSGRPAPDTPEYEVHRAGGRGRRLPRPGGSRRVPGVRTLRRLSFWRVVRWLVVAAIAWTALSSVLFLVSAQLQQQGVDDSALDGGAGWTATSANTILVLGSDARATASTREPGAGSGTGGSRSDTMLLLRTGGGASAKLSVPRDTIVDIDKVGRSKINAAYAYGGAALATRTVKSYLGIDVNHVIEVNFENFPRFIDAVGGIDYTGGCVVSRINGGYRNGGFTLRLRSGTTHIDGDQALALARTRKNECNTREDDRTRARRQQKILGAIKGRILSPVTFFRLPWVAWQAPHAVRSDMSGPSLLGLFIGQVLGGESSTRVLKPSGGETLPDGGQGLVVSEQERASEVRRFLKGG